jgi:hypothetical protein
MKFAITLLFIALTATAANAEEAKINQDYGYEPVTHDYLIQSDPASGLTYVSGGIGEDEQSYLQSIKPDYNTHLLFADVKTGGYLSEVTLEIMKDKEILLRAVSDGPYFYLNLPEGNYQVVASFEGIEKKRSFKLRNKNSTADVKLVWDISQVQISGDIEG